MLATPTTPTLYSPLNPFQMLDQRTQQTFVRQVQTRQQLREQHQSGGELLRRGDLLDTGLEIGSIR